MITLILLQTQFKEISNRHKLISQQQKILKIKNNKIIKIKIVNLQPKKAKKNKKKEGEKINGSLRIFREVDNILDVNLIKLIIKT